MKIVKAAHEHFEAIKSWKTGRLEERTCRPVINGKRISASNESVTYAFLQEDYDEPAGIFYYFDHNPRNRSCEFGYIVNPEMRNRGVGTEMLRACINDLFSDRFLNLNKLYCQTAEFNQASNRLLEKLEFRKDAVLREHHELDGKLWDDYIYSILKSEWYKCY
jgi:RimJ/RimL family protein N-acetyltransferase